MQTYVAEIDGRAVLSFRAENEREAQMWIDSEEEVRAELKVLENEGRRLWDGKAKISVRAATVAEQLARMKLSVEVSQEDGHHETADTLVFLVPVADPTDNAGRVPGTPIREPKE
jgi:hypothetical protein